MNRRAFILPLLLLFAVSVKAADGDITGVSIEDNGWIADVYIASSGAANTNGTLANGLGSNNALTGSEKFKLNITSCGYDNTGATTTVARVVYGTKLVRFPYSAGGAQNFMDTSNDGTTLKIKLALSDYVYQKDVLGNVDIASGLYATNSLTSSAATWATPINSSTQPYPKVIANWTYPGNILIRSNAITLRAVGFHWSATNGIPLACMQFVSTGVTSGTKATNTQTLMQISTSLPDIIPTGEYIASVPVTGFTDHELIRHDIIAFPWIGDSGSLFDSTANYYSWPYPGAITNRADVNNTWSKAIAVVDASVSDDTGAYATNNPDPTLLPVAAYFKTIGHAVTHCVATNNTFYGHNDVEGITVYLKSTVDTWTGSSATVGNNPSTWAVFTPYPGDTVTLTTQSGDRSIGGNAFVLQYFKGINNTAGYLWYDAYLWFDECTFNTAAAATINAPKGIWATHCTIPQLAQGIPYGTSRRWNLLRGCNMTGFNAPFSAIIGIGNKRLSGGTSFVVNGDLNSSRFGDGTILYNNNFAHTANAFYTIGANGGYTNGCATVQNLLEGCANNSTGVSIMADNTKQATNIMFLGNTIVGARIFACYNDSGTAAAYRYQCSFVNNIVDDWNIKSDVYGTANANRVGNWPTLYGVGLSGNLLPETTLVGAPGEFLNEFCGLYTVGQSIKSGTTGSTHDLGYVGFTSDLAWPSGTSPTSGGGDYRLLASSPGIGLERFILPYDIAGVSRHLNGASGAYEYPLAVTAQQPRFDPTFIILWRLRR